MIVEHASLSWALDENLEITASTDVTIQLSIIAEGLDCAGHYEGCHSRGLVVRTTSQRITLWRNLFAHNDYRNPELANSGYVDIRGIVAYDWKRKHMSLNDVNFGDFFNLQDTWFLAGPESQAYVAPPEQPFTAPAVPVTTNLDDILLEAGCRMRDVTDARIVADVQNGTGGLIDNPAEVGGWPAL